MILNVPVPLTSFIGRKQELAAVNGLLSSKRLVTLTGVGGCGKTRLALQVAAASAAAAVQAFPDGAWFVALAPLGEAALVPQQVSEALGLHPAPNQPVLETLLGFVRSKRMLLILDNCEHLRAACAGLAQQLLVQAPALRILATSREPLAIAGEQIYPLAGLACPGRAAPSLETNPPDHPMPGPTTRRNGQTHPQSGELMAFDAIRLFAERAQAIAPTFRLNAGTAPAVAEICRRLDGLPLALELASARANVLSVQEIAARLDDRFGLLTTGQRAGLERRHHSLRAVIDWSYSLLSADERRMLGSLAVFTGGCSLDTAQELCGAEYGGAEYGSAEYGSAEYGGAEYGIEANRMLDLLASLVDKSLLVAETSGHPQARYKLLETIREYALARLDETGETRALRDRHLALFVRRAELAGPKLNAAGQLDWLDWLEGEHDNLRAALGWALESGQIEAGLRIATAIVRFWEIRGYVQEAMTWMARLIERIDQSVDLGMRITALTMGGFLAMFLGDAAAASAYGQAAAAAAEQIADPNDPWVITALYSGNAGAKARGDFFSAYEQGKRAIHRLREAANAPFFLCMSLLSHADVALEMGEYAAARAFGEEALGMAQADGDAFRMAHAYNGLGELARCEGRYGEAQHAFESSVALLRGLGAAHDLPSIVRNLGRACLMGGDVARARALFCESLTAHQAEQNILAMVECLVGLGAVAVTCGQPAAGARLLSAALTMRGPRPAYVWPVKPLETEAYLELARARLTEDVFQAEQAAGQALSLDEAIRYASSFPLHATPAAPPHPLPDPLTLREHEVALLIAQGRTNRQIAAELVLSKRTVEKHVANILLKLGLDRRTQIVRWAIEHGLLPSVQA